MAAAMIYSTLHDPLNWLVMQRRHPMKMWIKRFKLPNVPFLPGQLSVIKSALKNYVLLLMHCLRMKKTSTIDHACLRVNMAK